MSKAGMNDTVMKVTRNPQYQIVRKSLQTDPPYPVKDVEKIVYEYQK